MSTFFLGWRRKIGVLMVVVACILMAGWVRSHTFFDQIAAGGNLFLSNGGCLVWNWQGWGGPDAGITHWYSDLTSPFDEDWYLGGDGVRLTYWSIVLPLTLLSAYLLLCKGRFANPAAVTEN